jgi:hypothetical protein
VRFRHLSLKLASRVDTGDGEQLPDEHSEGVEQQQV